MSPEKTASAINQEMVISRLTYTQIPLIKDQGFYRLDINPNDPEVDYANLKYEGKLKNLRRLFDSLIVSLSNWKYPNAILQDIEFTPAEKNKKQKAILKAIPNFKPEYPFYFLGSIKNANETYRYNVTASDGPFGCLYAVELQDVGNLWLANNGLRTSLSKERNGSLQVVTKASQETHGESDRKWHGWIKVDGEKPGNLIKDSIATINRTLSLPRYSWPLWKAS